MRARLVPDVRPRWLALSDALALIVFATVGLLSHDRALGPRGYGRDALPLLGCWFAAALVLRAYREPTVGRLLATWFVAVPLGVLVRALVLDRSLDADQAEFLVVALVFTLLFVLVGRVVLSLLPGRAPAEAH